MGDYKYNGLSGDSKWLSFTCILDNCDDGVSIKPVSKESTETSFWKKFTSSKPAMWKGHAPLSLSVSSTMSPNPKYFFNDISNNAPGVQEYVPYKGGKRKMKTFKRKTFKRNTFRRRKNKRITKSKRTRSR